MGNLTKANTKIRIEEIALNLFSLHGYHAVSIRDICKELGFTESSIYYHFKSKQAIMDSLLSNIDLLIKTMKSQFNLQFSQIEEIKEEEMCNVAAGVLTDYLLNPYVYKIILMLNHELISDRKAYNTYQKLVFELPLQQQTDVFKQMVLRGFIQEAPSHILAQQYYSIIYFSFQKNCVGNVITDEIIAFSCQEIKDNIREFFKKLK